MKVQELLMSIHNKEFTLEKRLKVKKYLPIEMKKTIAQAIIYESTNENNGVVEVDSLQRYLSYVKYMIIYHTDLEYKDEHYDVLCSTEYGESTLLNEIVNLFQNDANECSRILDLMMDDYLDNHASSTQIIIAINQFLNGLTGIVKSFEDKVSGLNISDMLPEEFDLSVLSKFLQDNYKE